MSTLNEVKYAALLNSTGATLPVTLNELEVLWLESKGRTGTLNEMWLQQFAAAGFTGKYNGAACAWLGAFGYLGTLNEMWYQFWLEGGSVNPNLIVNGDFATDTDWAKGLGWTISGGLACCSGVQVGDSDLAQTATLTVGKIYRLRYTVSNYAAGFVRPVIGGDQGIGTSGNGTIIEYFIPVSTGNVTFKANVDYIGCIDNVSLREVDASQFTIGAPTGVASDTQLGMHKSVAWVVQGDIDPLNYGGSDMLGLNVDTVADTIELYFVDSSAAFGGSVTVDFGSGGRYVLPWVSGSSRYKLTDAVQSDALWAFFNTNYGTTVYVGLTG